MLDIRRTDKEIGRITQLITSSTEIKGERAKGEPEGTRWIKNPLMLKER
jgi:hypothetical protein